MHDVKPPCCPVCGLSIRDLAPEAEQRPLPELFRLVAFADYRDLPEGVVGHPPGAEWFGVMHARQAEKLVHLPLEEALSVLGAGD